MVRQDLNQNWQMRNVREGIFTKASVPGSVYGDLLAAGKMDDPFYRDNEMKALALMDEDYDYETVFVPEAGILQSERAVLRFEGIDTVADIWLNGELIDSVKNMHRTYEYEVKDLLREGDNTLRVSLKSPTKWIKEAYAEDPAGGSTDAMVGFPLLRKAHCMFGWDWGPRLPDAGIWRPVSLLGVTTARIDSVYVQQFHSENEVKLTFDVSLDQDEVPAGLSYKVTVTAPEGSGKEDISAVNPDEIVVKDPELWWPNGYGAQPLYTVKVELFDAEGNSLDVWERRIGLRTVTQHIEKDQWGECFAHCVNGVDIFAMGGDYIPEDNLLGRVTPERTRKLLKACRDSHFNVIRVWGGGYYPDDFFFDICDEYGLLVWEDMMFACAAYNLTEDFEEEIRAEFTDNIKRLRHHASLGLWCGNNEDEMFIDFGAFGTTHRQKSDFVKMYFYILPKMVKELDPQRFYWPSSPSSGGDFDEPGAPDRGDVHYWDVWHRNVPFSAYREHHFRYLSEFGFQSFPTYKTVESFTLPSDRNIFSYVMEKHQRNASANGKILTYLSDTYLYPTDFATLLYASQLLQMDAIRYGVEHFRRERGRCMGTVYWQLNDCWPVASWASIDYYGRWKALQYDAKRFFNPILLSCEEDGVMEQQTNVNAEGYVPKCAIRLNVSNETREAFTGTVTWALKSKDGTVKREGTEEVNVPALTSYYMEKVDLPECDVFNDYVIYTLTKDGVRVSGGTVLFERPKHFNFEDPALKVTVNGDEITVTAAAYAKSVEIRNENEDLLLSDNYFDIEKGASVTVKVLEGDASKLFTRSVYDIR